MRTVPYAALIAAILLCVMLPAVSSAHVPNECAEHIRQTQNRIAQFDDGIEELDRLSKTYGADLVTVAGSEELRRSISTTQFNMLVPKIRHTFHLSVEAIDTATSLILCTFGDEETKEAAPVPPEAPITVSAPAEHGDWRTLLDEALVFAEEYEVALSIQGRCGDAYYEAYYGRPSTTGSFLDVVTDWARAKQQGQYADTLEALMLSSMSQAQSLHAVMQRQQIADRDRYAFSREYVEECRAEGIRAVASQ